QVSSRYFRWFPLGIRCQAFHAFLRGALFLCVGADRTTYERNTMARPDKAAAVEEIKQGFENSDAVLLTEYRGLTVAQLTELRVSLGENVSQAVTKSALTKIADKEAGVTGLDEHVNGPTALAFVNGEPPEAAKAL